MKFFDYEICIKLNITMFCFVFVILLRMHEIMGKHVCVCCVYSVDILSPRHTQFSHVHINTNS